MESGRALTSPTSSVEATTTTTALVDTFLSGRNPHTLAAYRHDLHDFARFVGTDALDFAIALLLRHGRGPANAVALAYKNHLIGRELSAATVNRRLAALRNLVALARNVGMIPWELAITSQIVHAPRDRPEAGAADVAAVLAMLEGRGTPKAIRDHAIIRLLNDLALQRAEVVSLDRKHVDLGAGTLTIPHEDRIGREPIALPKPMKDALRAWLSVRGDRPGPLFTKCDRGEKSDGRLTDRNLYAMVRRHGEAVGVHLRPHELRSAAIIGALARTDGDAAAVQRFSRHKAIATVKTYNARRLDRATGLVGSAPIVPAEATRERSRGNLLSVEPEVNRWIQEEVRKRHVGMK